MFVAHRISKEEAESIFSAKKGIFPLRIKKRQVFPEQLEVIYLPFYIFDVFVEEEGKKQKTVLSVDGLLGHVVFFAREDMSFEEDRNQRICDFKISSSEAEEIVRDEYKRLLLEHGLRMRRKPKIDKISGCRKIFHPFWIGYFKKTRGYDFKAIDAVSGEIQGVKMRKVFLKAFRQMN